MTDTLTELPKLLSRLGWSAGTLRLAGDTLGDPDECRELW